MFTHRAKINLKFNMHIGFSRKIDREIMPALRLLKGFCSGVTRIDTNWLTAIEDTQWATRADAEAYHAGGYLVTKKILEEVALDEPVTSIFETPANMQRIAM